MGLVYTPQGVFLQPDTLDFVAISLLREMEGKPPPSVVASYVDDSGVHECRWNRRQDGMYLLTRHAGSGISRRQVMARSTDRAYPPPGRTSTGSWPIYCSRPHDRDCIRLEDRVTGRAHEIPRQAPKVSRGLLERAGGGVRVGRQPPEPTPLGLPDRVPGGAQCLN